MENDGIWGSNGSKGAQQLEVAAHVDIEDAPPVSGLRVVQLRYPVDVARVGDDNVEFAVVGDCCETRNNCCDGLEVCDVACTHCTATLGNCDAVGALAVSRRSRRRCPTRPR